MRNRLGAFLTKLASKIVTQDYEGWKAMYDVNETWVNALNAENAERFRKHDMQSGEPPTSQKASSGLHSKTGKGGEDGS